MLSFGLSAGMLPADTVTQKKIYGSRTTVSIISKEKMKDIMKIVKPLEESGWLIQGISEN